MLDFHNAARILSASLVTRIFPVEQTVAAFEYAAKGLGMKALVAPDGLEALA